MTGLHGGMVITVTATFTSDPVTSVVIPEHMPSSYEPYTAGRRRLYGIENRYSSGRTYSDLCICNECADAGKIEIIQGHWMRGGTDRWPKDLIATAEWECRLCGQRNDRLAKTRVRYMYQFGDTGLAICSDCKADPDLLRDVTSQARDDGWDEDRPSLISRDQNHWWSCCADGCGGKEGSKLL